MHAVNSHRIVAADAYRVPKPFRTFAVRSDEPRHASDARAPYGRVHVVHTAFFDAADLARLAQSGQKRVDIDAPLAVDYAATTLAELSALTGAGADLPTCFAGADLAARIAGADLPTRIAGADLAARIASALQRTGVLGDDVAAYRRSVESRIDYLACSGAGFHNDVAGSWSRSLFWVLTLSAAEVEFVMPHAGVRLPLAPGDLLVFDQTMAHGLCRPADGGQALATSFEADHQRHQRHQRQQRQQIFLTGELALTDAQWAALGSPWLPVEHHARQAALDLMLAEFDERSGHIQRVQTLRDAMQRSTCHVDAALL